MLGRVFLWASSRSTQLLCPLQKSGCVELSAACPLPAFSCHKSALLLGINQAPISWLSSFASNLWYFSHTGSYCSFFPLPTRCSFRSQLWFLILKSPFRSFYLPPYRGFSFPRLLAWSWGLLWHLSGGCSLSHYVR